MRRRDFIAGLGVAAVWPVVAQAQQGERVRRIGVLMQLNENDPLSKSIVSAFTRTLADLGWTEGRNVRMEVRWAADNVDRMRALAKELVDLQPDVILASNTPATSALQQETRMIPIVFSTVSDPVGEGFIASVSRPGGNITGFINLEPSMGGKWLQLLKEIAPGVNQAAIIFNPDMPGGGGSYYLSAFKEAARSLKVEPITAPVHNDVEIEAAIIALGREPGGGLVVPADTFAGNHRALIIFMAARNNIPAVYYLSTFVRDGGLLSYGPDVVDIFRRSASYVDRILRGAKPVDLPVQLPTKFEMAVNLKTAKALGLKMPQSILLSADEVIE
jgi:putative ABC transport system substrate-binding protein